MTEQLCTFFIEDILFGVSVTKIQEVIRFQETTPVPLSSQHIRGLINLRGQIVTAVDLRSCLDFPARNGSDLPMNIVIRTDDGPVSLLIDKIGDVVEVDHDQFEQAPERLRGRARELILGAYKLESQLLHVLDVDRAVVFAGEVEE